MTFSEMLDKLKLSERGAQDAFNAVLPRKITYGLIHKGKLVMTDHLFYALVFLSVYAEGELGAAAGEVVRAELAKVAAVNG